VLNEDWPKDHYYAARGREEYFIAHQAANLRGHDLTYPEQDDGPGTFISRCRKCEGFLVGDPLEEDEYRKPTPFYGRAYDTFCTGAPPQRPALRRSEFDMAAPSTSVGDEWPDLHPPYMDVVQWYDPETDALMMHQRRRRRKTK
jgi:hypothetical protein